jgi:hypothetical protein
LLASSDFLFDCTGADASQTDTSTKYEVHREISFNLSLDIPIRKFFDLEQSVRDIAENVNPKIVALKIWGQVINRSLKKYLEDNSHPNRPTLKTLYNCSSGIAFKEFYESKKWTKDDAGHLWWGNTEGGLIVGINGLKPVNFMFKKEWDGGLPKIEITRALFLITALQAKFTEKKTGVVMLDPQLQMEIVKKAFDIHPQLHNFHEKGLLNKFTLNQAKDQSQGEHDSVSEKIYLPASRPPTPRI